MQPEERIETATTYMNSLLCQQGAETPYSWVGFFDDLLKILEDGKSIEEPTHPRPNIGITYQFDDFHPYNHEQ